jgi:hypothetical protein
MKTAIEIVNEVEPNGELLCTEQAVQACENFAAQFKYQLSIEQQQNEMLIETLEEYKKEIESLEKDLKKWETGQWNTEQ